AWMSKRPRWFVLKLLFSVVLWPATTAKANGWCNVRARSVFVSFMRLSPMMGPACGPWPATGDFPFRRGGPGRAAPRPRIAGRPGEGSQAAAAGLTGQAGGVLLRAHRDTGERLEAQAAQGLVEEDQMAPADVLGAGPRLLLGGAQGHPGEAD